MRTLCFAVTFASSLAFGQYENGGVWTGYVGGWKPNHQPTPSRVVLPSWTNGTTQADRNAQWQWWQMANIQSQWALQAELQRRTASEQAIAAQQAEAARAYQLEQARQAQLDAERRLAAEREAMLQRQLEEERRLTAEKELLAMQRLEAERASAAAAVAKANAEKAAQAPQVVASREEEKPATPGNDIYRWVDEEGVVHYSTRVPDSAKAAAKRVGGSR
ncbi:MAG: DUF4124 domain-containing protein [Myxococcaceae bacterium]|nr:DUF4124 domain-containing protein [Myxococcaceae bacterium]